MSGALSNTSSTSCICITSFQGGLHDFTDFVHNDIRRRHSVAINVAVKPYRVALSPLCMNVIPVRLESLKIASKSRFTSHGFFHIRKEQQRFGTSENCSRR